MSEFTILKSHETLKCTKTFRKESGKLVKVSSFDGVKHWLVGRAEFSGIEGMLDVLQNLAKEPSATVIRGRFVGEDYKSARRVLHDQYDKKTGEVYDAQFEPCDRDWVCIDVDSAPAHPKANHSKAPGDLRRAAEWIRDTYLPEEFHNVECVYQWSSSSGIPDWSKMAVHLWFLLERPIYAAGTFRDEIVPKPHLDPRLCNPVQVHYTADPIFLNCDDPLDHRVGICSGSQERVLVFDRWLTYADHKKAEEAAAADRQERLKKQRVNAGEKAGKVKAQSRYVEAGVTRALENIQLAGVGARHDTLYLEAHNIGQFVGGGFITRADAEGVLLDVAHSVFDEKERINDLPRIIGDALDTGETRPRDLSHIGNRPIRRPDPPPPEKAPESDIDRFNSWLQSDSDTTPEPETFDDESGNWKAVSGLIGRGLNEYGLDFEKWPTMMREAARKAIELGKETP